MAEAQTRLGLDSTKVAQAKPSRKAFAEPIPRENPLFRGLLGLAGTFAQDFAQTERDEIRVADETRRLVIEDNVSQSINANPNNGEKIKSQVDNWKSGFLDTVPESFRARAEARINKFTNLGIAQANQNLESINRQSAIDTNSTLQGTALAEWRDAHRGLHSSDPGVVDASRQKVAFLNAGFEEEIAGLQALADPGGLISEEIKSRRINRQNEAASSEVLGWYREQPDKEAAYLFTREGGFKKDGLPVMDFMDNKQRDRVLGIMANDITAVNAVETRAEQEFDKDRAESQVATTAVLKERIFDSRLDGGRLSDDQMAQFRSEFDAFTENEGISPDQKVGLLKFLVSDQIVREDPRVISRIGAGVVSGVGDWAGDIDTAELNGEIDHQTALRFRAQNQSNLAEARGVVANAKQAQINMFTSRLQTELSSFTRGVQGQAVLSTNRMITGVIAEFTTVTQDPDSKETPEQVFTRLRDGAIPTAKGFYRETLRLPYKLTKLRREVTDLDVVFAQAQLESDKQMGNIEGQAYISANKTILSWAAMFDAKTLEDLRKANLAASQKRAEGVKDVVRKELQKRALEEIPAGRQQSFKALSSGSL